MKNETTTGSCFSLSEETTEASRLPLAAIHELHGHWRPLLVLGIGMVVLGIIAMLAASLFTIAIAEMFGWLLIIAGAGLVAHVFWSKLWSGFLLQLLSGLLNLVVGWILAMHPELGAITLTLLIAISLIVQGAFRIGAALSTCINGWGSLLVSGIITLVLGLMIWNEWPFSGIWVIGLFAGIDMFFYGTCLVSLALYVRKLTQHSG